MYPPTHSHTLNICIYDLTPSSPLLLDERTDEFSPGNISTYILNPFKYFYPISYFEKTYCLQKIDVIQYKVPMIGQNKF